MMSAETGGRTNVSGSSIAMVASEPMPGNTPIRVPRKTPAKQYIRFCGVSATLNPRIRFCRSRFHQRLHQNSRYGRPRP